MTLITKPPTKTVESRGRSCEARSAESFCDLTLPYERRESITSDDASLMCPPGIQSELILYFWAFMTMSQVIEVVICLVSTSAHNVISAKLDQVPLNLWCNLVRRRQ